MIESSAVSGKAAQSPWPTPPDKGVDDYKPGMSGSGPLTTQDSNWRPWHTAPRDGAEIIAFFPSTTVKAKHGKMRRTRDRIMIMRWWSAGEIKGEWGASRRSPLEDKHDGFWGGVGQRSQPTLGVPSHWMPLPQPPQ